MKTRRGFCYPKSHSTMNFSINQQQMMIMKKMKKNCRGFVNGRDNFDKSFFSTENNDFSFVNNEKFENVEIVHCRKKAKVSPDFFDALPDDLVICILCKLSSSATCPADFINVLVTCKRLNELCLNSIVLSKASPKIFAIKAKNWCESAHRFLKFCSDAGNVEACYTLGMIRFYCLQNRGSGASLMAKAAINSHAQALYSLAVIQFNGSGGTKTDKDLRAGVALCARAAFLGHIDALRELGHCLQDGYGVRQNVAEGRRFLIQANARELAAAVTCSTSVSSYWLSSHIQPTGNRHVASMEINNIGCPLLSDFGCNVPAPEAHPANRFLSEWFLNIKNRGPGLRLCSHAGCGRPVTRKHEFRRCSVCGTVNYCSRACQALDWKLRHKGDCAPMPRWVQLDGENINAVDGEDNDNSEGEGEGEEEEMNGIEGMITYDGDR